MTKTWLPLIAMGGLMLAPVSAATASEPAIGDPAGEALAVTDMVTSGAGAYLAGTFAASQDDQTAAAELLLHALSHDSENVRLLRRAFIASVTGGLMDVGIDLAAEVRADDPDDQLAVIVLLLDDIRQNRLATALERMERVERTGIARYVAPMLEAWILAGLGETEPALEALSALDQIDGFEPVVHLHRALILDLAGDTAGAQIDFEAALGHGDSLRVIAAAGAFYERQGDDEKAAALYERFALANPQNLMLEEAEKRLVHGGTAPYLVEDAADGAAEAVFQMASVVSNESAGNVGLVYARLALFLRPDFPVARILLGDILSERGRDEEALQVYRAIDPATPAGWTARLRSGGALGRLERIDEAIELLDGMSTERPDRAEPLIQIGDLQRMAERYEEAIVAYDVAAEREPALVENNWSFYYKRGIALERARDFDRAIADLERAIELKDDHAHLLNYLGYLWVDRGENLEEAERLIREALEILPNDGYIIDSLGWAQYRRGQFEDAVETLERAVQFRPLDPVINDHLGDAYWQVGRRTEAEFQWRHALVGAEDEELIANILEKLEHGLVETEDTAANAATE